MYGLTTIHPEPEDSLKLRYYVGLLVFTPSCHYSKCRKPYAKCV